jgi:hypothetical protein
MATWDEIRPFAHTFDGYEFWGSAGACAVVANTALSMRREVPQLSLNEARGCLFFEARRAKWAARPPGGVLLVHIHVLVEQIRAKVDAGVADGGDEPSLFRAHYQDAMAAHSEREAQEAEEERERAELKANPPRKLSEIREWVSRQT